jgi:hypothetical protein
MDNILKEKWLVALRSGEYKQGQNQLFDGEKYCCLGVLAEICGMEIADYADEILENGVEEGYEPLFSLVDTNLAIYTKDEPKFSDKLIGMNDGGSSFGDIANFIEQKLITTN